MLEMLFNNTMWIPDGYDLVENDEHKKKRLKYLQVRKENLLKLVDETEEAIKSLKKDIKG